ncbi:MAG: acetyltransferase [Prevotella sp.]|jgi:sugar O-acyltransferase (sialic acid O-acetyltransferase NeuD family)|nr:acetyltransferase [Prevotella sp.]
MKKVYLFGAGGHAKVILDILQSNNIIVEELFDDDRAIKNFMGIPVSQEIKSPMIISIGNNSIRKKIAAKFSDNIYHKAMSKTAIISDNVLIGDGSVVMQGAIIQSSSQIGNHVIINTAATVDHDCTIHDFVHIAPGVNLCGEVMVGEGTLIGAGSTVIQGIKIGKWCEIGAGSVVIKDVPDNAVVAGVPAKILKYKEAKP